MSYTKRKIEAKIAKKDEEIQELETRIITLRAEKKGMEEVLKILPREDEGVTGRTIRANTAAGKVQRLLRKHGKPMYISDIVIGIKKANTHKNRAGLAGTLSAYYRNGEVFSRPAANTFGLLEWGTQHNATVLDSDEHEDATESEDTKQQTLMAL